MLPEEFRDRVFSTRNPQSESTFLVDGAVAGAWSYRGGKIALEPFRALDAGTMRELREAPETGELFR